MLTNRFDIALNEEIWNDLSKCYEHGTKFLPKYPNIVRTLNGLVLLGRNLVSVDSVGEMAWNSGVLKPILSLLNNIITASPSASSKYQENEANSNYYSKLYASCLQFFANFSVQSCTNSKLSAKFFNLLIDESPADFIETLISKQTPENSIPILLILESTTRHSSINCLNLYEHPNGLLLFKFILEHSNTWFAMQNDMFIMLLSQIILHQIEFGYAAQLLAKSFSATTVFSPEQTFSLLKLLDVGISMSFDSSTASTNSTNASSSSSSSDGATKGNSKPPKNEEIKPPGEILLKYEYQKSLFEELFQIFETIKVEAVPLIKSYKKGQQLSEDQLRRLSNTWQVLVMLFEIFDGMLTNLATYEKAYETYRKAKKISVEQDEKERPSLLRFIVHQTDLLESFVDLLHIAEKHLPKRNKLADLDKMETSPSPSSSSTTSATNNNSNNNATNTTAKRVNNSTTANTTKNGAQQEIDTESNNQLIQIYSDPIRQQEFPLIKSKLIYLLSVLTCNSRYVQDKMRELHALEVVLSNCIIDQNNPYIKENSILCLKYLLENNKENKEFIAKIEPAKNNVTEKALDDAGMEAEIVDGTIRLKVKS